MLLFTWHACYRLYLVVLIHFLDISWLLYALFWPASKSVVGQVRLLSKNLGLIVFIIDELFLRMLKSEQGFCSIVSQLWMNVECPLVNVGVIFPVPNSFDHSWNYAQWWTVKVQSSSIMAQWWIQSLNQWTLAPPICRLAETVLEIGRIQSGKGVVLQWNAQLLCCPWSD